jgi:hypothetical protein
VKYIVSAFCGDDGLDTDAGWVGNTQFVLQIQNPLDNSSGVAATSRLLADAGDNLSENDGPEPATAKPLSVASIVNCTFIGRGYGASKAANLCGPEVKSAGSQKFFNNICPLSKRKIVLTRKQSYIYVNSARYNKFQTSPMNLH